MARPSTDKAAGKPSKTPVWLAGTITSIALGALLAFAGSSGSDKIGSIPVFALVVSIAYLINWLIFVPSFAAHTEKYFDLTGSLTYVTVIVGALILSEGLDLRAWLAGLMVIVWTSRLGVFLFRRISRDGGDGRFDRMKFDFLQFFMTWTIQGLWVSLTAAAALVIITSDERVDFGVFGVLGFLVWLGGFATEVIADNQKSRFKMDKKNDGRFITTGLWSWSRHPNYFGEIVLWCGMAIMAIPVLSGLRFVALISPIFVFVLLTRISGIPLLRRRAEKRWGAEPEFRSYINNTSALIPLPPKQRP